MNVKVLSRVAALAVIFLAGIGYIAFDALQLSVTHPTFPVELHLPTTGGLFQDGFVSLRGVDVGRISSIQVERDGVVVNLAIARGTKIPADSTIKVRELSAVGEQYVDFTAASNHGPYLKADSVVSAGESAIPVSVSGLLRDGSSFANSINTPQVAELLQTLTAALAGTGPQLRSLLDSATALTSQLSAATPGIDDVLNSGQVLLQTGISTNSAVASGASSLAQLSTQLKASNGTLRSLLSLGPTAIDPVQGVLAQDQPAMQSLLQSSATITSTLAADQPGMVALFQALPTTIADLLGPATPAGIRVLFNFNDENDICTYTKAPWQLPTATKVLPVNLSYTCTRTAPDLEQRGAANAPKP